MLLLLYLESVLGFSTTPSDNFQVVLEDLWHAVVPVKGLRVQSDLRDTQ